MLDLTRYIAGPYCTKLFADYGGDVIKIEQQGSGDPIRHVPPFYDDVPDAEASLHFLYLNTNKRSITLDLKSERGQQLFLELARTADLVVENFRPGVLDRLGIGWGTLQDVNPRLVLASISNFGQTGPYRDLPASELVEYAMSGVMAISGERDRSPLKHGLSQAQYTAGAYAAWTAAAVTVGQALGAPGQWVDVSIHEAIASQLVMNEPYYAWLGGIQGRRPRAGSRLSAMTPARDGWVVLQPRLGQPWDVIADFLGVPELNGEQFQTPEGRALQQEALYELVEGAMLHRDKHELFDAAARRRILFGIAQDPADLVHCPQLSARGYWVDVDHPRTGPLKYAGAPVKMSATEWRIRQPAPLLGEHTDEVLGSELGMQAREIAALKSSGVV